MSEQLLEALIQLFAIVASVKGSSDMNERRMVVYKFLTDQLNTELAKKYIAKFDEYYRANIEHSRKSANQHKVITRISAKTTRIAVEMNRELSVYQKYIVLIQLYEYLSAGQISFTERGLVHDVVADKFNIPQNDFELIRDFILSTDKVSERIVLSGDENCETYVEPKYVFWEDLGGELHFVHLATVNVFLFKYIGDSQMEMNGSVIAPGHTYVMRSGNSIRNGVAAPIFFNDMSTQISVLNNTLPINFEARNVEYYFNRNTIGLHKFSFESHSGRLVGIMGVSGSGKSTFLNVISGMSEPQKGEIYINNINIYKNPEKIQGIIGYVAQDDILFEELTVYENLFYSARMSFDNLPLSVVRDKVDNTLHQLGLWEIRDIKAGSPLNKKISGGQRKRLNIALELIREPAVLILDEPTSGLSSQDSLNIIELLKDLTIRGKLIFVVIHQPSSDIFKMFDQLLVIDTGGYLIYDGNPVESLKYFRYSLRMVDSQDIECSRCGNINVEQLLSLISSTIVDEYGNSTVNRKISPAEWYDRFNWGALDVSFVGDPEPLPKVTFKTPNLLKQVYLYFLRDVKTKIANLQYILLNLFEAPILALVLSSLLRYYNIDSQSAGYTFDGNQNIPVYFVIAVIIAFFVGLSVSAEEIIQDRPIIRREKFLNLSRHSYILSKVLLTSILSAVQMLMFTAISFLILGFKEMFFHQWLILFSTAITANIIGLILSDTMKKTINIYIMIPFMVIPQLILSGVFVRFDKMNPSLSNPVEVPGYGNFITARWAFEALAVNQFMYNSYESEFYTYHKQKSQSSYYKDYWVPQLKSNLSKALKYVTTGSKSDSDRREAQRLLAITRDEIFAQNHTFGVLQLPRKELFEISFYGAAAYENILDYIEQVRKYNVACYNKADKDEDNHRKTFDNSTLVKMKSDYSNTSVSDFVCSKSSISQDVIVEYEGRLWQNTDQAYQDTDKAFRAPLFSPYKRIFGSKIDTYSFGVIVIWLQNILLYIVLTFGLLTGVVGFFGSRKNELKRRVERIKRGGNRK